MNDVSYAWRGAFENDELNALHTDAFGSAIVDDWAAQVERHSLGWVCARIDATLVGFVNVAWDGGVHAFLLDTIVRRDRRRQGIGAALVARAKVPDASFYDADLHAVPMADDSVDLVVCALALTHVPDLTRALRELVRVLRPGGHLVLSDARGILGVIGLPLVKPTVDGGFGYMPTFIRPTSEYLEAALALGLHVRCCVEPRRASPLVDDDGTDPYDDAASPPHVPGRPPNVWALHPYAPAATNAAYDGAPIVIVWHFQLGGPSVS